MPDSFILRGFLNSAPTSIELASYLLAEEGIDFDTDAIADSTYAQNAARDGGVRGYGRSRIRTFKFPLRVASGWPGAGGLNGFENFLRELAHPFTTIGLAGQGTAGGMIDILPENASHTIRYELLGSKVVPRPYSVYMQRLARRDVDLLLDVQPFGYLGPVPTEPVLASTTAASGPLEIRWNASQILGDAPGPAVIEVGASYNAASADSGARIDGVYWSISAGSGGTVFMSPSLLAAATISGASYMTGATHITDAYAPAGMALRLSVVPSFSASDGNSPAPNGGFRPLAYLLVDNRSAFTGLFRILLYARTTPSHLIPWQITADIPNDSGQTNVPLASRAPVATLYPQQPSWGGLGPIPSFYQVLDLGEYAVPNSFASGPKFSVQSRVRVWGAVATANLGVASPAIDIGGLVLLPVDGDSGIIAGGMLYPTGIGGGANAAAVHIDGVRRSIAFDSPIGFTNSGAGFADARIYHTGAYPAVSTQQQLNAFFFSFQPAGGATNKLAMFHQPHYGVGAVRYRPSFSFLRGL